VAVVAPAGFTLINLAECSYRQIWKEQFFAAFFAFIRTFAGSTVTCYRAQEIRAVKQKKALEAQQAEQRRLEEERFVWNHSDIFYFLLISSV